MIFRRFSLSLFALAVSAAGFSQTRLTLDECRSLAVSASRTLEQSGLDVRMAGCDRAIARANYFPNISASGMYLYNNAEVSLIDDEMSQMLLGGGSLIQGGLSGAVQGLTQAIMANPAAATEYSRSAMWQTVLGALSQSDVSNAINAIGSKVDDLLHPEAHNITIAGISVSQPVFVGGKIAAANRIATLAEQLASSRYDTEYQQTIVDVEQAYWQIVSISAKKELAQSYVDLLSTMARNVNASVEAGVATKSDELSIRVKANEAEMMLSKATNGLKLAKMLLCKQIGLPLDSDITLADEGCESVAFVRERQLSSASDVISRRPELRSLDNAAKIFEEKVKVARADMMPQIALTGSYMLTNPNFSNGLSHDFNGFFTAGVMMKMPLFHGFEAQKKAKKAALEAKVYRSRYDDAVNLVNLELSKLNVQRAEALERIDMSKHNLESAEENLRTAMLGFGEGVVETSVTLAAQTAWLQAHSDYIDAGIELMMTDSNLNRAEGNIKAGK